MPGLGSPAGREAKRSVRTMAECQRTNVIRHQGAADLKMDGHPGGMDQPGFSEAMSLRKAHRAPYRPPLESPRCTRRRRVSRAGPSGPASVCGELGIAPEGARKRADRAYSSSNRCDGAMARRAGVRTPRPCRGVFELLFLGSYLPTFKERYPDPEGPARNGESRSQKPPKSPPNGLCDPLGGVSPGWDRQRDPSISKEGGEPLKDCMESASIPKILEISLWGTPLGKDGGIGPNRCSESVQTNSFSEACRPGRVRSGLFSLGNC